MKGSLTGRSILVVEDEPLIAMAISQPSKVGRRSDNDKYPSARPASRGGRRMSAAILDHSLSNSNSSLLYARLKERGNPPDL